MTKSKIKQIAKEIQQAVEALDERKAKRLLKELMK